MYYVIMNRSNLDGWLSGTFQVPGNLFYETSFKEGSVLRHKWTAQLSDAMRWPDQDSAWDFLRMTWGLRHANENFMVLSVHRNAINSSANHRARIHNNLERMRHYG